MLIIPKWLVIKNLEVDLPITVFISERDSTFSEKSIQQ